MVRSKKKKKEICPQCGIHPVEKDDTLCYHCRREQDKFQFQLK